MRGLAQLLTGQGSRGCAGERAVHFPIIIEADTLDDVEDALAAGAHHILLDNMSLGELRDAVKLVGGRAKTEASGGVRLNTVADIAATGVDFISVGALRPIPREPWISRLEMAGKRNRVPQVDYA